MFRTRIVTGLGFALLISFAGCRVDPELKPALPVGEVKEIIPQGWPQPAYRFEGNAPDAKKFELGRALFYETRLSKDNTISCGSCHQQYVAFAHADHDLSHGFNDAVGVRNSPALFNLTWHSSFMHDGGVNHIEVQPIAPITNPVEMGEELSAVISKLNADPGYKQLFADAYGSEEVSSDKMLKAMAQFMGMLYSYNSKYDKYKRGEPGGDLRESELRGYSLFVAKCGSCHKEPLFSDFEFRNNGLKVDPVLNDSGRAVITLDPKDLYKFKTPSLRNVAVTAPYMHDGRYRTLEECLEHYTSGIRNYTNLDPLLQEYGIPLESGQRRDIIAFLHTLTDFDFIKDKRFADPNFR